ncbi:glycoside hydrolase family 32 protein [Maribacter sp. 2210JD10-5]|uniref:glycoside hydrolase family 32 protein n=1 Tax=Maribacter sp. 2210JD10-5 TaxID=3386272 RepID=UPI0039BC9E07
MKLKSHLLYLYIALGLFEIGCNPVANKELSEILISKNYLVFPVDNSAKPSSIVMLHKGDSVSRLNVGLSEGKPDFYSWMNVSRFKGEKLHISIDSMAYGLDENLRLFQSDTIPGKYYAEQYRPQFHYSPKVGWVNDPNGMFFYNGTYHMFYQYNPYGQSWDNMHWGYATSHDLVHWQEHDPLIAPNSYGSAYSGSAVVDFKNTSGLQTGEDPPLLLFYTAAGAHAITPKTGASQHLVYSIDGGQNWISYQKNPIIPKFSEHQDRDPKVVWYEKGQCWIMMLFIGEQTFRILKSENAIDWEPLSDMKVASHNECPDLFQLSVENNPQEKKWVFISGAGKFWELDNAKYVVGTFDGKKFIKEQESLQMDSGIGNYSTQTFSNAPDNRRIFMGWFTRQFDSKGYTNMPSNAQFRVPWELKLFKTENGYSLHRYPVKEIDTLRGALLQKIDIWLKKGEYDAYDISRKSLDIELHMTFTEATNFTMTLADFELTYEGTTSEITAFGKTIRLRTENDHMKFRMLLDQNSLELFLNEGETAITGLINEEYLEGDTFKITCNEGELYIKDLKIYDMQSIWNTK